MNNPDDGARHYHCWGPALPIWCGVPSRAHPDYIPWDGVSEDFLLYGVRPLDLATFVKKIK